MSAADLNPNYGRSSSPRALRARRLGVRAALGMGVTATMTLLMALLFGAPREARVAETRMEPQAATPQRAATPSASKFATKIAIDNIVGASALVARPFSAFDIASPEFAHEKKTIAVREGAEGLGRIDSLTMGRFAMGGPFMRVDVHQDIAETEAASDFFLDMTRHAAQAGLDVAKIGQPAALLTRFGAFETADIRLVQPAADGVAASERACLAARLIDAAAGLEIAGLACGEARKPIDRVALGCILDKLAYAPGADNVLLNDFLKKAEAGRGKDCVNVSREDVTATIPAQKRAGQPASGAHRARAGISAQSPR